MYAEPDVKDVPVDRLIENLEAQAKANPKEARPRENLARVHAMAFALKTTSAKAAISRNKVQPWFGFLPQPAIPFQVKASDDPEKNKTAAAHLKNAIARYEEALELDPNGVTAALGHAWCLHQAGEKEKAIAGYRRVIELAWAKDQTLKSLDVGARPITQETSEYLIPLLDAKRDAEEITKLKERVKTFEKLSRWITPIAIPLRDDLRLEELEDRTAHVEFDADGSAKPQRWSWITPNAAWLVHDPNTEGKIDSGLKLFGSVTFWMFWDHGYRPLAALDDNRDGELSGSELRGLALWHDRNGNGKSEPGEVKPLAEYGVVALSCRSEKHPGRPEVRYSLSGVRFQDGTTRPSYDLMLERKP